MLKQDIRAHAEVIIILQVVPAGFWNKPLWDMVTKCTLEPTVIGFNMGDVAVMDNLPERLGQLLMVINRFLPKDLLNGFAKHLKTSIGSTG